MIGKKFIEEHNIGQKVKHAIHLGAKVAAVGATAYALHQKHKDNEVYKHILKGVGDIASQHGLHTSFKHHDDSSAWGLQPLHYDKLGNMIHR